MSRLFLLFSSRFWPSSPSLLLSIFGWPMIRKIGLEFKRTVSVYRENVEFVSLDKLWELIEKYLPPQAVLQKLEEARSLLENWDAHYRIQASTTETGIQFTTTEKFPGAS